MSQKLELPDEVYNALERVAKESGPSLDEWIASQPRCRDVFTKDRPLSELLDGLNGVIDSTVEPISIYGQNDFRCALLAKFEKQGLRRH
jgi:hypothetical protein